MLLLFISNLNVMEFKMVKIRFGRKAADGTVEACVVEYKKSQRGTLYGKKVTFEKLSIPTSDFLQKRNCGGFSTEQKLGVVVCRSLWDFNTNSFQPLKVATNTTIVEKDKILYENSRGLVVEASVQEIHPHFNDNQGMHGVTVLNKFPNRRCLIPMDWITHKKI